MSFLGSDTTIEVKRRAAGFDATVLTSAWGIQAQAFGWTASELPKQPAANYSRLSRIDEMGLIWLQRGRPVMALTATEAVMRCPSSATLTYRRRNEPAVRPVGDSIDARGAGP